MPTLSSSARLAAVSAAECIGVGAGGSAKTTCWRGSDSVSPVRVSSSFDTAPRSPAANSEMFCVWRPCTVDRPDSFSLALRLVFVTGMSLVALPDTTRRRLIRPTYGSLSVLNTKAENGASAAHSRVSSSSEPGLTPVQAGRAFGAGQLPLKNSSAEPRPLASRPSQHSTGTSSPSATAFFSPLASSAAVSSPASRYFSVRSSSVAATASISFSRASATASARSPGTSVAFTSLPLPV